MSLDVKDLTVGYGRSTVLHDVGLTVDGGIVTVVGSNGAGKTTLLRSISGLVAAKAGCIMLDGDELTGMAAHRIVAHGVVHVPEGRHVFPGLTVDENLDMGAFLCRDRDEIESRRDAVFELFPVLLERRTQGAGTLSGGEQQMLAIGRGLMSGPRVLLLDEPSLGLAPAVTREIAHTIVELGDRGIDVLLVEQDARMALSVSSHAHVLINGRIEFSGPSAEIAEMDTVRSAYMGG